MRNITVVIVILGIWAGCFALTAWVFSLVWNWLAPGLFGWPSLSLWQTAAILILVSILAKVGGRRR